MKQIVDNLAICGFELGHAKGKKDGFIDPRRSIRLDTIQGVGRLEADQSFKYLGVDIGRDLDETI